MNGPPSAFARRLDALAEILELGEGIVAPEAGARATATLQNAGDRLRHGTEFTVVAFAGATGSGKSTLFNAIVGEEIAAAGITRPTTAEARAAVFGGRAAGALLDWLEIKQRHGIGAHPELDGLVLIDLPDHDSVETSHRLEVDHFVAHVDLLIWVLDPQKYADQVLHERYLSKLSSHGEAMAFLLHQADRLPGANHAAWKQDAQRLLAEDGLLEPTVLITSATSGLGIDHLRQLLADRITSRTAALARIDADLKSAAAALGTLRSPPEAQDATVGLRDLTLGLADAAGATNVSQAVRDGFRHDAARVTGWPFTRWLKRFRRHPLRKLRPATPSASRPTAVPIDQPRLDLTLKTYADQRSEAAPPSWARRLRKAAEINRETLVGELGRQITTVAGAAIAPPRWWRAVSWLQRILGLGVAAGGLWLVVLLVLDWLRIPSERLTPGLGGWPLPTLLLLGGAALGLVVAALARGVAAIGGTRRAGKAEKQIAAALDGVANRLVVTPVDAELARWATMAAAVEIVAGSAS